MRTGKTMPCRYTNTVCCGLLKTAAPPCLEDMPAGAASVEKLAFGTTRAATATARNANPWRGRSG